MSKNSPSSNSDFSATYRLQLRKEFPFSAAAKVVPYLDELGISHLYLSPILEAVAGSNHGYDGLDPQTISRERGGEAGFNKLLERVKSRHHLKGVILDLVPNHLASSWRNPAWWDMLKRGSESVYWKYFDVKPRGEHSDYRVILPVLGRNLRSVLAAREIQLDLEKNELAFSYYDNRFPVSERAYPFILPLLAERVSSKKTLSALIPFLEKNHYHSAALQQWLEKNPKEVTNFKALLHQLPVRVILEALELQNYILMDWRTGSQEINYRRFFDINDLAGLRVEDPEVLQWSHGKIWELMKQHAEIHGLRIDHIDGLNSPIEYLQRLCEKTPSVWVEKLLSPGEKLDPAWPVLGSTGYEFLSAGSRLFVNESGAHHLQQHSGVVDNSRKTFEECAYESKCEIIETHFVAELNYLVKQFYQAALAENVKPAFSSEELHQVLREVTLAMPVYRTYAEPGKRVESPWLEKAFAEVEKHKRVKSATALAWFRKALATPHAAGSLLYTSIKRWEQFSGPMIAKGLEDTAIYRYCPLLFLSGIGESVSATVSVQDFHAFNAERLQTHPLSMSTTTTHDTKRSEDVNARVYAFTDLAATWTSLVSGWISKGLVKTSLRPQTLYFIYETIVISWPADGKVTDEYITRLQNYFIKAAREAKTDTYWTEPHAYYEEILRQFVVDTVRPRTTNGRKILQGLQKFTQECMYLGAFNSLSMTTLKALSPGLPDFYQGCDMWDLSLVDPDNRRPVDYELRTDLLKKMKTAVKKSKQAYSQSVLKQWQSGEVKLWLTWNLLQLRQNDLPLFQKGDYVPLRPQGKGQEHFVAFLRHLEGRWLLVVVPRFLGGREKLKKSLVIQDPAILATEFVLPKGAPQEWTSVLNGQKLHGSTLPAADLFAGLPVAIYTAQG